MSRKTANSGNYIYSEHDINKMKYNSVWNNHLDIGLQSSKGNYELHATGDCDLGGRVYVALPSGLDTTDPFIKNKYNLI